MAAGLPVYYHGAISKAECEAVLGDKSKDGAYLIRDSETIQGAMCLCVYKKNVVYTYRMLRTCNGQYTLQTTGVPQGSCFKTLDDLVRHFKKKNQGLAMHLRHAVKRKTALLIRPQRASRAPDPAPAQSRAPSWARAPSPPRSRAPSWARAPSPEPAEDDSQDEPDYENVANSDYVDVLPE